MNVFAKYTRRCLEKNKTRSTVTLIGIILSMAMLTAVVEAAFSGITYLRRVEIASTGAFHGFFKSQTSDDAGRLAGLDEIESSATWSSVGWAEFESKNEYMPYILVQQISDGFEDLVSVKLTEGRMPENDGEIILPTTLKTDGGYTAGIGDVITLSLGKRCSEGYELSRYIHYQLTGTAADLEEITDTREMTFTVVGKYEKFDYNITDYNSAAYIALTYDSGKIEPLDRTTELFFTVEHPSNYYDFVDATGAEHRDHSDLIRMYGLFRSGNIMRMVYSFAFILVAMIAFGSVSLIYNSFSISIGERVRQFGILKSIGATRPQIRRTVILEACMLSLIAIPIGALCGCLGIGVTFYFLRDSFVYLAGGSTSEQMRLVITPTGLACAALLCFVIVLISAYIPARRAIKISPISAVRQSGDIVIKNRAPRTSKLTEKLFGFEGMMASKNFGRNKRRYRSTVVSLFLSVTLFISASSFCAYLTRSVTDSLDQDAHYDISYYIYGDDSTDKNRKFLFEELSALEGVKNSAYVSDAFTRISFDEGLVHKSTSGVYTSISDGKINVPVTIKFVDDSNFRELCIENGLDPENFFDKSAPKALLQGNANVVVEDDNGDTKIHAVTLVDDSLLPFSAESSYVKQIEGYFFTKVTEKEGEKYYVYLPDGSDYTNIDEDIAIFIPETEAQMTFEHNIAAAVKERPFYCGSSMCTLIYPYSMVDEIKLDTVPADETDFYFVTDDHAALKQKMKTFLEENGFATSRIYDKTASNESSMMIITVIKVFSYGFIVLISLIAASNVFNTISTNILLRRREFAMLRSVGMTEGSISKMMNYECLIYGAKGLLWGLPASFAVTFLIWRAAGSGLEIAFYIPIIPVFIAVGSVFAVVFASMLYAMRLIRNDNPIDALKNENQ